MVNELLGIQYNIAKANVTDRKVQNLASYINKDSLGAIHRTMDKNKASGIDKMTKEEYEQNCQTAHCGRRKPHVDFGTSAFPTAQSRGWPQTFSGAAARCRNLV